MVHNSHLRRKFIIFSTLYSRNSLARAYLPPAFLTFQLGIRFSPRVARSRPVTRVHKRKPRINKSAPSTVTQTGTSLTSRSNNSAASTVTQTGTSRPQNNRTQSSQWSRPTGDPPSLPRALPKPSKEFQVSITSGAFNSLTHCCINRKV